MTKKLMFMIAGLMLAATLSNAQAIVGRIDNDGVTHMTVEKGQAKEVLKNVATQKGEQQLNPVEITFTTMPLGQICLTGYEKDKNGNIIKGYRIMCKQDDANNLIVVPESKSEKVFGRPFADNVVVSQ